MPTGRVVWYMGKTQIRRDGRTMRGESIDLAVVETATRMVEVVSVVVVVWEKRRRSRVR